MKKTATFFIIAPIVLLFSCKKNVLNGDFPDRTLVEKAKVFFNQEYGQIQQSAFQTNSTGVQKNPRLNGLRTVLWDKAYVYKKDNTKLLFVPVQFNKPFLVHSNIGGRSIYSINDLTRLCLYQDSVGSFHLEWLSFFPDSNYLADGNFSGIVLVDGWRGNPITKYRFEKGGGLLQWDNDNSLSDQTIIKTESIQTINSYIIETCYTIMGYNYSATDPGSRYYWSEPAGCTYRYIQSFAPNNPGGSYSGSIIGPGAGGAGIRISPINTVEVIGGNNIIGNIIDYDKCFTNVGGTDHTFQVSVCVDQPSPGKRTPWGLSGTGSSASGNPIDVGHSFLVLTEITPSGQITRNVGFYPTGDVNPLTPSDRGQLNNDANHPYNISLTINMTNSQFFAILNFIAQGNNIGFNYDLNTNNCSSFVIHALYQAGIYLPSTIGSWPNGSGNDPGDLGEDIRNMGLSSNMTRNTIYNYHPNFGSCY